jgi:hypothetical protein
MISAIMFNAICLSVNMLRVIVYNVIKLIATMTHVI